MVQSESGNGCTVTSKNCDGVCSLGGEYRTLNPGKGFSVSEITSLVVTDICENV